jgi:hypothetical protein
MQIKSIFEQISADVFAATNLQQTKTFIKTFINEKKINDKDKQLILKNVDACKTLPRLQMYVCNSLLQFEGMGLDQLEKSTIE